MFNHAAIHDEIETILCKLDAEQFPEACACLRSALDGEESPFLIASHLMEADKPGPFPPFLLDFIAELYHTEIAMGNSHAMNNLGAHYYSGGRGFAQSFEKAVDLYRRAADLGNRQAQENLGYCHYYGRNMPVDYEKAFHYFALGAFDGWPISLYKIGDMYLNGYYVKKDEREAWRLYNRCLQLADEEESRVVSGPVHLRLGRMCLEGIGTDPDPGQALLHFNLAEIMLYQMVRDGDYMYNNSLRAAIEGQKQAREKLLGSLPDREWTFDD
ncbi:MAG: sel1 repeat family protein [Clostridia bacterium]|nr:sel1 repeat family protein [Clostridia bacterium]